jgi:hypothetical protein
MNGSLTYASAVLHQAELRAAAERGRRAPRNPRSQPRLPGLPWRRRPRKAYA